MRIVSLLSSATEIVDLLGLGERLVGISHECDHPPHLMDRPRVSRVRFDPSGMDSAAIDAAVRDAMERHGSVYAVDVDLLQRLNPDVVLTQAVCEVCAVPTGSVLDAVGALAKPPQVVSLDAHSIEEILGTILQVGTITGAEDRGVERVRMLRERLQAVEHAVGGRARPRVLLLEWLDPPFQPGHWVPEMVERAGGECLAGEARRRSVEVSWKELEVFDPDVLLIEPCGYGIEQAVAEAERFEERLRKIAPRAYQEGRVAALDSAWFSRSGPRVVEGIEAITALLHPGRSASPPPPRIASLLHEHGVDS